MNSATSTLRKLQRQVAVLSTRLSELDSTENCPSDSAESGGTVSGDDEFGGGEFESRPGPSGDDRQGYASMRVTKLRGACLTNSGPNMVRCTKVLVWTPLMNTVTEENGCAVLEAGVGGHVAGLNMAVATA